jgi:hypothetical protein
MQCVGRGDRKRAPDLVDHQLDFVIQLMIRKSEYAIAKVVKPSCSSRIVFRGELLLVLRAVEFDDEFL